ncbi:hypothetical protein PoB_002419500 [Plakobranchus ocellatus]|uniref:Uncharacterized protein n=1 Tax=Plakobranchus ocellatus TaxID=259542 RepID=A0AAV3ZSV6_9GAST|nr:hypothetical protein PoB_002419500 [Plakobranchus ocellatus]
MVIWDIKVTQLRRGHFPWVIDAIDQAAYLHGRLAHLPDITESGSSLLVKFWHHGQEKRGDAAGRRLVLEEHRVLRGFCYVSLESFEFRCREVRSTFDIRGFSGYSAVRGRQAEGHKGFSAFGRLDPTTKKFSQRHSSCIYVQPREFCRDENRCSSSKETIKSLAQTLRTITDSMSLQESSQEQSAFSFRYYLVTFLSFPKHRVASSFYVKFVDAESEILRLFSARPLKHPKTIPQLKDPKTIPRLKHPKPSYD